MADPTELLASTVGGLTVGGLLVKLIEGFGKRSIVALDETLKSLKGSIDELGRDIRALRETDIAQAKDIGALQESVRLVQQRVDGQGAHYRDMLEEHKRGTAALLARRRSK
jgi:ABC-type transporter Mla subunit MlaD